MHNMIQKLIYFEIKKIQPLISDVLDFLENLTKTKLTNTTNDILFDLLPQYMTFTLSMV